MDRLHLILLVGLVGLIISTWDEIKNQLMMRLIIIFLTLEWMIYLLYG